MKSWARLNNFKGCFGLICHFTIPSPPALPIHVFGLNMYFLSNTLLNYLLQVPTLAHQVVYWLTCALLGKLWEHLTHPQPRQLQPSGAHKSQIYDIFDTPPLRGGQASPTPVTEILNIALEVPETNAISFTAVNWVSCENLSKIEQFLRGVLAWSAIHYTPRHLHSQYMYFGLN